MYTACRQFYQCLCPIPHQTEHWLYMLVFLFCANFIHIWYLHIHFLQLFPVTPNMSPSQLQVLYFLNHWFQIVMPSYARYGAIHRKYVKPTSGHNPTKGYFPPPNNYKLPITLWLATEPFELSSNPHRNWGWLDLVQVLCRWSPMLWHNSHATSRRQHFTALLYILWLLHSFHSLFHDGGWALVGELVRISHLGLSTLPFSLSTLTTCASLSWLLHIAKRTISDQGWEQNESLNKNINI